MPKLVSLLEAGERGQYSDLQWFYHYMERSDAMIASVLQRRRAALLAVDFDIRQVAGAGEVTTKHAKYAKGIKDTGNWKLETGGRENGREEAQKAHNVGEGGDGDRSSVSGERHDRVLAEEQRRFWRRCMMGLRISGMRCRFCFRGCSGGLRIWRSIMGMRG